MRPSTLALLLVLTPTAFGCEDEIPERPRASESTTAADPAAEAVANQIANEAHQKLAAAAQGRLPAGDAPQVQDAEHPSVGGIAWEAPAPFTFQRPSSPMRAAEYLFPEEEGEEAATMTVSFFPGMGGSVQDNLDRWIGQFTQPDGSDSAEAAQTEEKEISGLTVHTLDVAGTFSGGMPGMGGGQPQPERRMLAAIVVGPRGPVFFKLVGQQSVMERAEGPFGQMLESLRPL